MKELKQIHKRLETLEDAILSPDDRLALEEARKELKKGKTSKHEKIAVKFL